MENVCNDNLTFGYGEEQFFFAPVHNMSPIPFNVYRCKN